MGQSLAEDAEPISRGRRAFLANNALTMEIRLTFGVTSIMCRDL
jgi:hypothetical protein